METNSEAKTPAADVRPAPAFERAPDDNGMIETLTGQIIPEAPQPAS